MKSQHFSKILIRNLSRKLYYQLFKRNIFGLTGPIRLLPDFIIIGTARSGSTSLYNNICQHPCVLPAAYDELGFFDSNFHLGLNWYRSLFPTIITKWFLKLKKKYAITGEDTPFYIWSPIVAKRILKILPNVKLLIIFRNPIDRAYSNYHLGIRSGSENLSFEDAIKEEQIQLNNIDDDDENNLEKYTIPRSYISKGFYADQLKIWKKLFNPEQLLIISTEDFEFNSQETLNKIYDFLGVPKQIILNPEKHKVASYPKMKNETRIFLADLYKKHNEKLFDMIGQEFDWNK